jgi:PhnB protein
MKLCVYVNFKDNCLEAFDFYVKHLGGKIISVTTFGQMPGFPDISDERKNKIIHGRIEIGETVLMGADIEHAEPMRSAYLTLLVDDEKEAERIYKLLIEKGDVFMKMEKTVFAERFAMLRDRFGVSWMLLCEK